MNHNQKNWHWVSKDVKDWTEEWLSENLVKVQAEDGDVKAKISKVKTVEGDVDVSQRKGKVITVFDVKIVLEYTGSAPGADEVTGSITIPEVAHDTDEDGYVFDVDVYSESKEKQPVKALVQSKIVPQLRTIFQGLTDLLIKTHGPAIQHIASQEEGTAGTRDAPKIVAPAPTSKTKTNKEGGAVNTTTVTDNQEFRTTAEEAYQVFVDPQKIAAFTRAPPKVFEGAKKGGKFEIFDGNVVGEYIDLVPNKKIVQSWRLQQWPAGHFSTLNLEFDQNDVDHVTTMRVTWEGVPVGQEEVTKRNWSEYYVIPIIRTFGFGSLL